MCFNGTDCTKYIAEKDIVCYKCVSDITKTSCESIWTEFPYTFGKLYNLTNSSPRNGGYTYEHINQNDLKNNKLTNLRPNTNEILIDAGFHSWSDRPERDISSHVKCIIPAGSEYYKNSYEYVSNQLIVLGKLGISDRIKICIHNFLEIFK